MLDFVKAFKHENEGTVVEVKNLQGLEVQFTYHLGGSNYNYKTLKFEEDDIVVAGKYAGLLRYIGPLTAEQKPNEPYYIGLECFEQLKEDEIITDHSQYFESKYSYNTGILVPCTEFKCKLTCYDVVRWFVTNSWKLKGQLRQYEAIIALLEQKNQDVQSRKVSISSSSISRHSIMSHSSQISHSKSVTANISSGRYNAKNKKKNSWSRSSPTRGNQDQPRTDDEESERESSSKSRRAGYMSSSSNEDSVSLVQKGRALKKSDTSKKSKHKRSPLVTAKPAQKSVKKTRKTLTKKKSLTRMTSRTLQGTTSDSDSNASIPGDSRKSFVLSRKIDPTSDGLWNSYRSMSSQEQTRQYYRVHAQLAHDMSMHNFKSNFGINQPLYIEVHHQKEHDIVTSVFDTLEKAEMGLQLLVLGKISCQPQIEVVSKSTPSKTFADGNATVDEINRKEKIYRNVLQTPSDMYTASNETTPVDSLNDSDTDIELRHKPTLCVILSNQPMPDDFDTDIPNVSANLPVNWNLEVESSAVDKASLQRRFTPKSPSTSNEKH